MAATNPEHDSYRPRLSIEISNQQARDLQALIPWGLKQQVFCVLVDDVIRLAKRHGPKFLAAVLSHAIHVEEYSSIKLEAVKNDDD